MKKMVLLFGLMLTITVTFAQQKPKSMKQVRDSVFTEMKLSDENRQMMHDLIAESGKGQKAIREDASLNDEQKKEKLKAFRNEMSAKEKAILTPEQREMWVNFGKSLRDKRKAQK